MHYQIMKGTKNRAYIVPLLYTLVWCIGLCIGVFGLLPTADGGKRMIIAAFSVYGIFCVNSLLDILFYYLRAVKENVKPAFGYMMLFFAFAVLIVIVMSDLYLNHENVFLLIGVLLTMGISNYGMGFVKHNPSICFEEIQGKRYKSNFKL